MRKYGLLGGLVLALVVATLLGLLPGGDLTSRRDLQSPAPTPGLAANRYLRTGQWRADARTLVAALDFLLAPDGVVTTNRIALRAQSASLVPVA